MPRLTLANISYYPEPQQLYEMLMDAEPWQYKTNREKYHKRDLALVALLYLGDFRAIEVVPLTTENFEKKGTHYLVKAVKVGKKKRGKIEYREAKLPLEGERACFTELVSNYVERLKNRQRLFHWSTRIVVYQLPNKYDYITVKGETKHRYSVQMVGTKRAYQIVKNLLPDFTQHWLRAFGYNFDYDNMAHDVLAVSDKTKADPRSLQPYLRRRYDKYPVR